MSIRALAAAFGARLGGISVTVTESRTLNVPSSTSQMSSMSVGVVRSGPMMDAAPEEGPVVVIPTTGRLPVACDQA